MASTYYIATTGDDSNDGSIDHPFLTLEGARDTIRGLGSIPAGGITVYLRGGTYHRTASFDLTSSDASTSDKPIVYRSYPGETAVLSGGAEVAGSWTNRGDGTYWVSVGWSFKGLWVDNVRATRARLPTSGYYTLKSVDAADALHEFHFNGTDIDGTWTNLQEVEVINIRRWEVSRHKIDSVSGEECTCQGNLNSAFGGRGYDWDYDVTKSRYFVENVYEAVNNEGYWYYDTTSNKLYYTPPSGHTPSDYTIVAGKIETLLDIDGADYTEFRDLEFRHCDWDMYADGDSCPDGDTCYWGYQGGIMNHAGPVVMVYDTPGVKFVGCTFASLDSPVIWLDSSYDTIERCTFTELGAGAIRISSNNHYGLIEDYLCHHNNIISNTISGVGRVFLEAQAITLLYANNNLIQGNTIDDVQYTGIQLGWKLNTEGDPSECHDNTISDNVISNCMKKINDGGCIYCYGDQGDTVLERNTLSDTYYRTGEQYEIKGIRAFYMDTAASNLIFRNNLIVGCAAHWQLYGNYCDTITIESNVLIDATYRGFEYAPTGRTFPDTYIRYNVLYQNGGMTDQLFYRGVDANMYTHDYNLYYQASAIDGTWDLSDWKALGYESHCSESDPLFVDYANGDYRLRVDSPAIGLGFTGGWLLAHRRKREPMCGGMT